MAQPQPHILIIMPDQHRSDALGCADHPVLRTPHLDRLAAEGVRFANAFTVSPICMPARQSFVSGLYPHNHMMWTNSGEPLPEDETFFQLLQRAGYYTAHVGKGHYYPWRERHLREREPWTHRRGFDYVHETTGPHFARTVDSYMTDHWHAVGLLEQFRAGYRRSGEHRPITPSPLPVEEHLDSYVGRIATEFSEGYRRNEPCCLFVGFGGPHDPWDAPGEYAQMYNPPHLPPPIPAAEPGPWVPAAAAQRMREGRVPGMTEAHARQVRANYYGKITLIDHWIGQILEAFNRRSWSDETLVVFLSDHGEMAGDHQRLGKVVFYEGSIRVPLIVRWQGRVAAGATAEGLVENIDVFPTVLEAASAAPSRRALGRSLWPALRDPSAQLRPDVLSEVAAGAGNKDRQRTLMLRTARYKYAVAEGEGFLLHDLEADPSEQVNLLGRPDYRALEAELRDRLFRRLVRSQPMM